jgi:hypothetical protein
MELRGYTVPLEYLIKIYNEMINRGIKRGYMDYVITGRGGAPLILFFKRDPELNGTHACKVSRRKLFKWIQSHPDYETF